MLQSCGNNRVISVLYNDINFVLQHYKYTALSAAEAFWGCGEPHSQVTISHIPNETSCSMTNGPPLSATDMWEKVSFLLVNDSQLPQASNKLAEAKTWGHTEVIRARKLYYRENQITMFPLLALYKSSEYIKRCLKHFYFLKKYSSLWLGIYNLERPNLIRLMSPQR